MAVLDEPYTGKMYHNNKKIVASQWHVPPLGSSFPYGSTQSSSRIFPTGSMGQVVAGTFKGVMYVRLPLPLCPPHVQLHLHKATNWVKAWYFGLKYSSRPSPKRDINDLLHYLGLKETGKPNRCPATQRRARMRAMQMLVKKGTWPPPLASWLSGLDDVQKKDTTRSAYG